ncbi:collagen binding domain-containing protein [Enterococcus faecalis]
MKKIKKYLSLTMIVTLILINFIQMPTALAVDYSDGFITKGELQDTDGNPKNEFEIGETMIAHYEYNIPDDATIKAGDTMTVKLPKELIIANDTSFNLVDDLGNIVGTAKLDKTTGEVVITFTDYYETNTANRKGTFDIYTNWNKEIVSEDETIDVDLGTGGSTIVVTPPKYPDPTEKLLKWGWINENDPTIINWVVRVNYEGNTIYNAVYTDYIGDNQIILPESLNVNLGYFNGNDFTPESKLDASKIVISSDGKEFTVNYGNLTQSSVITYQTQITDNGNSSEYKNNGKLTGENIEEHLTEVLTPNTGGSGNGEGETTEPSTTEPSTTEPSTTEPSTTEPSATEPSATEPNLIGNINNNDTSNKYSKLPNTGQKNNNLYMFIMGICLVSASIIIWNKKKIKK